MGTLRFIVAGVAALLMAAAGPAWAEVQCSTTTDPKTGVTTTHCFEPGTGFETITTSTPGETVIIDVPVPPPPGGTATTPPASGDPVPEGGGGDPDPATGPPTTTTTTDPEHFSSRPGPNRTIEANEVREDSKARARKNLGYEEVPEFFGQQRRGQDLEGLSNQIRRLSTAINKDREKNPYDEYSEEIRKAQSEIDAAKKELDEAVSDYEEKLKELRDQPRDGDRKQAVADAFRKKQDARRKKEKAEIKKHLAEKAAAKPKPKPSPEEKRRAQQYNEASARLEKAKRQIRGAETDYWEQVKHDVEIGQKESKQKDVERSVRNRQRAKDRWEAAQRELQAAKDNMIGKGGAPRSPRKFKRYPVELDRKYEPEPRRVPTWPDRQ